jgi:CheY-like chemotaxis protein
MDTKRANTALLIDDDPDSQQANQLWLEREGYSVVLVKEQNDGLARARQIAPNAIFIHLVSEATGSLPFIQALRSDDVCRHIRVVVLGKQPRVDAANKRLHVVPRESW